MKEPSRADMCLCAAVHSFVIDQGTVLTAIGYIPSVFLLKNIMDSLSYNYLFFCIFLCNLTQSVFHYSFSFTIYIDHCFL